MMSEVRLCETCKYMNPKCGNVIGDCTDHDKWQPKEQPVKTLADMGIKRGAKFLYGGNEYTIDFLHATQNQGNTMCHCYSFDKMTLVKPEVTG